jgi:hypothetical protein
MPFIRIACVSCSKSKLKKWRNITCVCLIYVDGRLSALVQANGLNIQYSMLILVSIVLPTSDSVAYLRFTRHMAFCCKINERDEQTPKQRDNQFT